MTGYEMGFLIAVLLIASVLFAMSDRRGYRRGWAEARTLPACFASEPGPAQIAENDCVHCAHLGLCHRVKMR